MRYQIGSEYNLSMYFTETYEVDWDPETDTQMLEVSWGKGYVIVKPLTPKAIQLLNAYDKGGDIELSNSDFEINVIDHSGCNIEPAEPDAEEGLIVSIRDQSEKV
jgi:hypothetical protein